MKRNRTQSRSPIRERILEAARGLFIREGFEAVAVRRIAERARCSPGMLYHFFSSKECLPAHLVENTFLKLHARMAGAAAGGRDPLQRLNNTLHAYIQFGPLASCFGFPVHTFEFRRRTDSPLRAPKPASGGGPPRDAGSRRRP